MTREAAVRPDGDEVKRLEGCINDMISVLALPAIWTGREPSHVVSTLLEALLGMLRLDFAYARLSAAAGGLPIEVVRSAPRPEWDARPAEVGAALARVSAAGASAAVRVPNPVGDGEVSIASCRLGIGSDAGVLVAGSQRGDFPTKTETLLMRVAANQAGIGLREVQLLGEYRRERTRVEGERRALASLVEHSTDFIGMAAPDGQVLFVNPAGREMVGLEGDAQARATQVLDYLAEEERDRFETYILPTVLRDGRWEGQTRFRHFRTGAAIPMLQNIFVIKEPRTDRLLALGTISRDITERLRSEENLRDSERRFRLLAEAIPHQVWSSLPDGSLDYCNRRWMDYHRPHPGRRPARRVDDARSSRRRGCHRRGVAGGQRPRPSVRSRATLARSRWPVSSLSVAGGPRPGCAGSPRSVVRHRYGYRRAQAGRRSLARRAGRSRARLAADHLGRAGRLPGPRAEPAPGRRRHQWQRLLALAGTRRAQPRRGDGRRATHHPGRESRGRRDRAHARPPARSRAEARPCSISRR